MIGFEWLLIAFLMGMVVMAIIAFVFQRPRYP